MATQNTLTAPADRDNTHLFDFNQPPLTDEQTTVAVADLVNKEHLKLYPQDEKAFADPYIDDQDYCLVSFIPSITAKPDKDGIYGMIKVRGTYNSLEKCDKRSEFLIKNIDSLHNIFYAGVGKPFPITNSSNFSKDINKIKIQDKLSEEHQHQQKKEEREIQEIKDREKEILEQNKSNDEPQISDIDKYITNRVKKAQLTWTYIETIKKLDGMKKSILNARKEISELDESDPTLKDSYLERYNASLKKVNLEQQVDSFIQYIDKDPVDKLGF